MRLNLSRLNAWQRLAVVLTILWLLLGTHHFWIAQVDANYSTAAFFKKICEQSSPSAGFEGCYADYNRTMERYGNERWGLLAGTFVANVLATAAFWLAVWLVSRVVKWILAGRHPN